jgi:hypothetical protein
MASRVWGSDIVMAFMALTGFIFTHYGKSLHNCHICGRMNALTKVFVIPEPLQHIFRGKCGTGMSVDDNGA